jgi:serine/threonine protein kinase
MDTSVESFCNLLARSRLISAEEVRGLRQRWLAEANKDAAGDAEKFSEWLASHQYITEYQAKVLLRGHADRFFLSHDAYKLLERIGKGRMAGVYKAVHRLGQTVAIKVLPPSKAKDPQLLARFQREARLAMRLKHPNVVRTFQTGEDDGLHFLVMEYLEGEPLDEVLERRGKLPPAEAVRLVYQALLGLQHLHDQNMVHRDLKPGNLMLVPPVKPGQPDTTLNSTVKIVDIGLGRALFDEGTPGAEGNVELTTEGAVLGTPAYLAPEQARDAHTADIRADIYSLGCVLYHALAGQAPFADTNLVRQMVRHATEPPKPLRTFNREVPDGLEQIVQWMLAKDPAQRYPTPERAAKALQVYLAAGQDARRPPEGNLEMQAYLMWLETNSSDGSEAAPSPPLATPVAPATRSGTKPAPSAAPAARPAPPKAPAVAPPARPAATATAPARAARAVRPAQPVRPIPAKAAVAATVDVELVPAVPPGKAAAGPSGSFPLSRRELLLLALGAGGLLLVFGVIGIVWFIIHSLSKKKDATPEEE